MDKKSVYTTRARAYAVLMILTLLWLTVSIPVVFDAQQELAQQETKSNLSDNAFPAENDDANPYSGSTEEKTPASGNLSEEYIHGSNSHSFAAIVKMSYDNHHSSELYIAFHGDLHCPPPNSFLS